MTYVLWSCYTSYNDPLHYAETRVRTIRNMCATIIIIVEKNLFFLQSRNSYIPSNTLLPKFHGSPLCAGSQHKKLNYLSHDTSAAFWIRRDLNKDCANILTFQLHWILSIDRKCTETRPISEPREEGAYWSATSAGAAGRCSWSPELRA